MRAQYGSRTRSHQIERLAAVPNSVTGLELMRQDGRTRTSKVVTPVISSGRTKIISAQVATRGETKMHTRSRLDARRLYQFAHTPLLRPYCGRFRVSTWRERLLEYPEDDEPQLHDGDWDDEKRYG